MMLMMMLDDVWFGWKRQGGRDGLEVIFGPGASATSNHTVPTN
jgi:hypothetical protein